MEFDFDIHGNLKPYRKVTCDLASLHLGFVAPFEGDSTRHQLFDAYLRYCDHLKNAIGGSSFAQWLDGSFISAKRNPNDVDVVNLIPHQTVERQEAALSRFIGRKGKENYGMDAYIVVLYPENHPFSSRTRSDLAYWTHWFSQGRKNRRRTRDPKGFIELNW